MDDMFTGFFVCEIFLGCFCNADKIWPLSIHMPTFYLFVFVISQSPLFTWAIKKNQHYVCSDRGGEHLTRIDTF